MAFWDDCNPQQSSLELAQEGSRVYIGMIRSSLKAWDLNPDTFLLRIYPDQLT